MRRFHKLLIGLLSFGMIAWPGTINSRAAAESGDYTYTVTFYTGNHGSFTGRNHISVDNSKTASEYQVAGGGAEITVSGLKRNDVVSFDAAMEGAVELGDGKYYVKGIRQSGRDNNTVATSAFRVEGDRDYVVAYGIRGDMTSYVVEYQDAEGNTLAPSRTYYGNIGDKPVVAFLYIEGYEPQAYNQTKTLDANAAENVFTFVYSQTEQPVEPTTGGDETPETTAPETTAPAGTDAPGTPEAPGGEAEAPGGEAEAPGGEAVVPEGETESEEETANLGDEEVPLAGPEEVKDLDDEEVPLAASNELKDADQGGKLFYGAAAVAVAGVAVILFLLIWLRKRTKKEKAE